MFADFYSIFYNSSLLLSVLMGLTFLKKSDLPFRWITLLMTITLASEMVAKYLAYGLYKPNSVVYHIFTPVEYALYVIIFLQFLGNDQFKKPLWLSAAGLFVFEIVNTLFFQSLYETSTNVMIAESVLLVILSLILFIKLRETPVHQNILKEGVFWFNSAILCYYAFNILIWGFHSMKVYLLDNPPRIIYQIILMLSGLLYLTFSGAILLHVSARQGILERHE